jgi:hypothetical protein
VLSAVAAASAGQAPGGGMVTGYRHAFAVATGIAAALAAAALAAVPTVRPARGSRTGLH